MITFATNNGDIAGGEVMLFAMADAARHLVYPVTVVGPAQPSSVVSEARDRGFRTIEIEADDRRSYLRGLRRWDRTRRGLLWCNGLVPSFATAGHAARLVHLHQRPQNRPQQLAYQLARLGARRVVVPSASMARDLPGTQVLSNWVEPIDRSQPRAKASRHVMIGYLGRLSVDKGLLVLADALWQLEQRRPGKYRLLLAGEARFVPGAEAAQVERAMKRIDPLVHHAGWMDRDDFFDSVDLAVFPSVWPEPFGLVVAEAQSARVPFVISDAGALTEVAGPGYPWVAPAGDADALALAIERATLEASPAHLDAAHARWQQEFSPEAGRRRIGAVLAELGYHPGGRA